MIERLSKDLQAEFPDMKGFSPRNLGHMKKFAETCTDLQFVQQAAAKLPAELQGQLPSIEELEAELEGPGKEALSS